MGNFGVFSRRSTNDNGPFSGYLPGATASAAVVLGFLTLFTHGALKHCLVSNT